jgi:hypothetical protein
VNRNFNRVRRTSVNHRSLSSVDSLLPRRRLLVYANEWAMRELPKDAERWWSRGWGTNEEAGPDGLTAGAQYIFGASRQGVAVASQTGRWSTDTLSPEAVARTNDPAWSIFGEFSAALDADSWTTNEISWRSSTNQRDVLPGTERRVSAVPTGTNTKKFLRINAQNP